MKKLQTILNELIKVLNTKKELLNTILKNKKENDKKEFSQEQVLKGQEINNQIYNTKYMIEGSEKGIEEHKRLMKEANNYIDNKHISYEDFLSLCDIYNIKVAARTKGHLKNADACIKNGSYQLPKKMKASNTVLNLSEELYKVLLEDTEQKENDKINDSLVNTEIAADTGHPEEFYILNENREYIKVEGYRLKNKYNFDLFYHEVALGNWRITHTLTGIALEGTITGHKDRLINKLDELVNKNGIENMINAFNYAIDQEGYVPGKDPGEKENIKGDNKNMIMYKSPIKGWIEVTEDQKENLVKHLYSNTPAIKMQDKEEYINSRFKEVKQEKGENEQLKKYVEGHVATLKELEIPEGLTFEYMNLNGLKYGCEYYLGEGNRNIKFLSEKNEVKQIEKNEKNI